MFKSFSVLAVLAAHLASAKVFVLDDSNFETTLASNSPMLVEFYAPWCGHCKALEPEYEAAGKILTEKNAKAFLGKVDATSDAAAQLAKRFKVEGFPTLKFFPKSSADSEVIDYDGERKTANIVSWLEKKTGPAFVTISDDAVLNKAKASVTADNEKVVVIGVFAEKEQVVAFEQVAKKDYSRDYYAVIGNSGLGSKVASGSAPLIQVLRSFNMSNPAVTTNAETIGDASKLEKFIAVSSEPTSVVVAYSDNDILSTIKEGFHVVEFYAPWCGYCKQFAPEFEKVADHFLAKNAKVTIAKYDGTLNEEVSEKEGIDSFPTIKLYKDGVAAQYKGEMSKENVIRFIEDKMVAEASTITSEANIPDFVSDSPTAIVGCVTAKNEHIVDTIAFQAAGALFKVGKVRCNEGKEHVSIYNSGQLRASYPAEQSISDISAVTKWYKRASISPVFKFDDMIFDEIIAAEYKYVVFYFNNQVNGDEAEIKLFQELAAKETFKDTAYAYASASEDYLLQFFHVRSDALPASRLLETAGSMTSYMGPDVLTKESLETMFEQLKEGNLEKVPMGEGSESEGEGDNEYSEDEHAHGGGEADEEDADDEEDPEEDEQDEL